MTFVENKPCAVQENIVLCAGKCAGDGVCKFKAYALGYGQEWMACMCDYSYRSIRTGCSSREVAI